MGYCYLFPALLSVCYCAARQNRPNIVFIVADDLVSSNLLQACKKIFSFYFMKDILTLPQ